MLPITLPLGVIYSTLFETFLVSIIVLYSLNHVVFVQTFHLNIFPSY